MPFAAHARLLTFVLAIATTQLASGPLLAQGGDGRGGAPPVPQGGGGRGTGPALPEIPRGTGFILGRTMDVGTGQPVAGAVVTLTRWGGVPGGVPGGPLATAPVTSIDLTASAPRRVISNGDGYFLFRELSGGRFSIAADALGYLTGGYLKNKPSGAVHFLDLGENKKLGEVQIKLWKFAAIGGTVLDEAGEPAVGATIRLIQIGATISRQLISAGTQQTDDRGNYRFGSLSPGDYVVGILTTQSTIPTTFADAYADAQAAQAADRSRPQSLVVDARNNGVVVSNVSGIRVGDLILQMSGTSRLGYTPPPPADDGRMLSYVTTFYPNAPTVSEAATIALGSGEERTGVDLSIKLVPTVRISGTVTGPDGPARNMGVSLVAPDSARFREDVSATAATAVTDQNGTFRLLGVPAGTYIVKSTRVGLIRTGPTPVPMLWAAQPITVERTDLTGINVVLRPGLTVSGHVEFVGSKPAPTAQELARMIVTLVPATGGLVPRSSGATVAADGTFQTPGDRPGRYFAQAQFATGWTVRSIKYNGRNIAAESIELTTSDLADVVVTFTDKVSKLTGTITDARGAPDPLTDVIAFPADVDGWRRGEFNGLRTRLTPATKAGTFGFSSIPSGQYYVVAVDDGATSQWTDPRFLERLIAGATKVTIAEGEEKLVDLKTFVVR